MNRPLQDADECDRDGVILGDHGLGFRRGADAQVAELFREFLRVIVLAHQNGAGQAGAQLASIEQAWRGPEVMGDPLGLGGDSLVEVRSPRSGRDLDPDGFAFLAMVHGFLGLEDIPPIVERAAWKGFPHVSPLEVAQLGVHHGQDGRGASPGLGEFRDQGGAVFVLVLTFEGEFDLGQETAVAFPPFVEALFQVTDHEDAATVELLPEDLQDIAAQDGVLGGAGVLELVEHPMIDLAIESEVDLVQPGLHFLASFAGHESGLQEIDVVREGQLAGPHRDLIVPLSVEFQELVQAPGRFHPAQQMPSGVASVKDGDVLGDGGQIVIIPVEFQRGGTRRQESLEHLK